MKRILTFATLMLLLTMIASSAAHADSISFALDNPTQTAKAGSTIDFTGGTGEINGDYIFVNGDSFSIDAPLTLDDSGLSLHFDQFYFAYQQDTGELFSVTLPSNVPSGTYLGSFTLLGGYSTDDQNILSTQNFSITTVNTGTVVPEPPTVVLFGSALLALFCVYRRKILIQ